MMRKNQRVVFAGIFILMSLFLWNCSWQGDSVGQDDEILVFADSTDWPYYEDALNTVFGRYIRTPAMESEYLLKWVPFKDFEHYRSYKNIFILGRLNSNAPVSENVKNLLDDEALQGVREGRYFYIPRKNAWAVNQYVLFLVANSRDDMIQKIIDYGDLIYEDFRKFYFQRLKKEMFKRMEQKDLEKYIADHFPFTIRVQHDYFIASESLEDNYVWIRRLRPDRSIFVHWLPKPPDFELTSNWVIQERNDLARKIYSGDVVVEDETKAYAVEFKRWNAIRLQGTWRNDSLMIGGPFRNISFVDTATNRIYMIDFYVQAIGQRKKPYLDQLDVIVHTFDTQKAPRLKAEGREEKQQKN